MTVKEKKRGRPKASSRQLSRQVILNAAKQLMQEEGKIPSIRKLATRLSADAMAIYHYFTNKSELLEGITTSLVSEIYDPCVMSSEAKQEAAVNEGATDSAWQDELFCLCESYVKLLEQYPGLLETLLSMESIGPAEVFNERFSRILTPLNLDDATKSDALDLLADYLHGFALALNTQKFPATLSVQHLKGPLALYCHGLSTKILEP